MAQYHTRSFHLAVLIALAAVFLALPVQAFTANSLDIKVDKSGDATAVFQFTLEGLIENAIPQSLLEEQLIKGLGSSSEPPTLVSMDRSSATLVLKKFANTYDTAQGMDYQTSSMDFKKAEIALQNSAVSSVITADFSPAKATLTFPDGYVRSFSDVESLPSITHTVIDPAKAAAAPAATVVNGGAVNVTAIPADAEVWIDGTNMGNAPAVFTGLADGQHTLTFQKAGYVPVTKVIAVTKGKTVHLSVFLAEAPPTTEKSPADIFIILTALAGCLGLWAIRRR
jgi:hypothetical protein